MSTTKCDFCAGHKWRKCGRIVCACPDCWGLPFIGELKRDAKTPADKRRVRRAGIHMRRAMKASLRRFKASL